MYILDYKINKSLNTLRDHLTSEFLYHLEKYGNKITQNRRQISKRVVSCFLLNTYQRFIQGHYKVGVTLDESNYSKPLILNGRNTGRKVSYTYTRSFLDFLILEDYIDLEVGGKPSYGFHNGRWQIVEFSKSYVTMKDKLKNLYDEMGEDFGKEPLVNVIILRDSNKRSLTYKMNEHIKEVKNYLQEFNKFSRDKVVKIGEKEYDVQSYKVYNTSFQKGGRTHMKNSIQHLSKSTRLSAVIEGEEVCSYDFKGFEPSLAYSMSQEVMECSDPYELDIEDYDKDVLRKFCKLALLIMFNTDSKSVAHKALNSAVRAEFDVKKLYDQGKIPEEYIPVKLLMEELETKHHIIADKFYKGFGADLQYAGSLINDYIVEYMMQAHGCLVVQTHDEFMAPESFREKLVDCMYKGYEHICGSRQNCRIVKEK